MSKTYILIHRYWTYTISLSKTSLIGINICIWIYPIFQLVIFMSIFQIFSVKAFTIVMATLSQLPDIWSLLYLLALFLYIAQIWGNILCRFLGFGQHSCLFYCMVLTENIQSCNSNYMMAPLILYVTFSTVTFTQ